jgi:hypothetical protein
MKMQISRLAAHQNAKVFAVLMALFSSSFAIPLSVMFFLIPPPLDPRGNPIGPSAWMFLLFPIMYLVMGYILVLVGSAIYNFMFKFIGGFEFESTEKDA